MNINMHNPAHPGELLNRWLGDLAMSVTGFSEHIGISRAMLSRVLNARSSVTADMDLRLAEALGTSPGYWLALQSQRGVICGSPARPARIASASHWCPAPIRRTSEFDRASVLQSGKTA